MRRRRYGRRRSCLGKVQHRAQAAAEAHRDALLARGATGLTVYPCRYCGAHHVGHQSTNR